MGLLYKTYMIIIIILTSIIHSLFIEITCTVYILKKVMYCIYLNLHMVFFNHSNSLYETLILTEALAHTHTRNVPYNSRSHIHATYRITHAHTYTQRTV